MRLSYFKERKGQAINIDWSIGLGLLLLSLTTAILMIADYQSFRPEKSLDNMAKEAQSNLRQVSSIEGYQNSLLIRSPKRISNVPIDRNYSFPEDVYPDSGYIESGGKLYTGSNRIVTVQDFENNSKNMVYFTENVSKISYTNDIETGSWLNNSEIKLKTGSPGLKSMRINGREILNSTVEVQGSDYSTEDNGIYGSSLSGDLKIYNNTREFIIEDSSSTFDLKNLSTLYWYEDNSTTKLEGTGTFKSGDTKGLTIASDYGATFIGDLTATVSKPNEGTVRAEIDAERLRVRIHDSNYISGWKRIKSFDEGYSLISGREEIEAPTREKLEDLNKSSKRQFEENMSLEDSGYNISVIEKPSNKTLLAKGENIPLRNVITLNSGLSVINRTGNFEELQTRVTVWR